MSTVCPVSRKDGKILVRDETLNTLQAYERAAHLARSARMGITLGSDTLSPLAWGTGPIFSLTPLEALQLAHEIWTAALEEDMSLFTTADPH